MTRHVVRMRIGDQRDLLVCEKEREEREMGVVGATRAEASFCSLYESLTQQLK